VKEYSLEHTFPLPFFQMDHFFRISFSKAVGSRQKTNIKPIFCLSFKQESGIQSFRLRQFYGIIVFSKRQISTAGCPTI
jgi:hypothetical protein